MGFLDTNGFNQQYYIRVQRNMIEAGITSRGEYYDLYIDEITTDPTAQSICECCSIEGEKTQYIKYKFHLRSRVNPDFKMVLGSTCIEQYQGIDPDELKHALLLFDTEKKRVDKLRREDLRLERVQEYANKYTGYIAYLDLYRQAKGYLTSELIEVNRILLEGKKVFRDKHKEILETAMADVPARALKEQLNNRGKSSTNRAADWHKTREEAAKNRENVTENKQNTDLDVVKGLLMVAPENVSLQTMRNQLEQGLSLIPAQQTMLTHLKNKVSGVVEESSPSLDTEVITKMESFLKNNSNDFIEKMLSLASKGVTLSQIQHIKIDGIIEGVAKFDKKFENQLSMLHTLNRTTALNANQRRKFKYLNEQLTKARHFGKFYTPNAEKNFVNDVSKLFDEIREATTV